MSVCTVISGPDGEHQLGAKTTPETILTLLSSPDHSWDDSVERYLEYCTPRGTLSFTFAHYRIFFGPSCLRLTSVELDTRDAQP
jgi:hypothetical protein